MVYISIIAMLYASWRMYKNYKDKSKYTDELILVISVLVLLVVYFIFRPSLVSDIGLLVTVTIICWYLIRKSGWKRAGLK